MHLKSFFKKGFKAVSSPAPRQMVEIFLESYSHKFSSSDSASLPHRRRLVDEARKAGYYCYANLGSSRYELMHFLSLGLPVVVEVRSSDGGDKLGLVVSVDTKKIEIVFPHENHHQNISIETFEKMWGGGGKSPRCYLLVLSLSDFNLGRQYFPLSSK